MVKVMEKDCHEQGMLNTKINKKSVVKYLCLILLTVMTTTTVLLMRYSRISNSGVKYLPSTAVMCTEIMKLIFSVLLLFCDQDYNLINSAYVIKTKIICEPLETLKLVVPSSLYTVQNNLLYVALTNLDAATYQITYQLKILTTALFSVALLSKQLHIHHWISMILLMGGVSLVQLSAQKDVSAMAVSNQNYSLGLICVLLASLSSGLAGVYFERLVKVGTAESTNLPIRNLQLVVAYMRKNDKGNDIFQGFNEVTWMVISLQSVGGLLVAATIKYADNILKCFATSISIVISSIFSYWILQDLKLTPYFLIGTFLVISATLLYSYNPTKWIYKINNINLKQNLSETDSQNLHRINENKDT